MKSIFNNTFFIFIVLAVLAAFFSPFASVNPDGLDWTVEQHTEAEKSELEKADKPGGWFIFADYKIPFIKNESISTIFSGLAGLLIIMFFFKLFFKITKRPSVPVISETGDMKNSHNAL